MRAYIQFPINLLRDIHANRFKAFDNMLNSGIYMRAKQLPTDPQSVARQMIYDYYSKGDFAEAIDNYAEAGNIELNPDYKGFDTAGNFDADAEIQQLVGIFATDSELYSNGFYHLQLHNIQYAADNLHIEITNPAAIFKAAQNIDSNAPGAPFAMVTKDLCFRFRDNEMSEFDLMQFAAHAALTSILGTKANCKTNKQMILSRMFGYASPQAVPDPIPANLAPMFDKYQKRHHIDKLLKQLKLNWFWAFYAYYTRGMYVARCDSKSDLKTTLEGLVLKAETSKENFRIKQQKTIEHEIRKKVIQQLQQK